VEIISDIASLRKRLQSETSVAFVPTMGNLHAGHLSLVQLAQQRASCTVVSVFVNRLQFAPHEDYERYPRTQKNDCSLLEEKGVDVLFLPAEETLYPIPQEFQLKLPPIADTLEGACRPGFFHGVTTVVLKLFNIVQPQCAVFGEKDYQQLQIIRRMVDQLNLPIEIMAGQIIREEDGLALSSRNNYLNIEQRKKAVELAESLQEIKANIIAGERNFTQLERLAGRKLHALGWKVDYVAVRQQRTLLPVTVCDSSLIILGAAWLDQVRLIDNCSLTLP
jgi:pantoate--beta-alanine ligase